jgi:hypothetical protein
MLEQISQLGIISFSGSTIFFLSNEKRKWRKIGYIVGILGEPFWFYTTLHNEQWGIFVLSLWYTLNFCKGLYFLEKSK